MFEGTAIQSAGPLPQSHQVSTVQYRSKSQPHRPLYGYVEDEPFAYFVQVRFFMKWWYYLIRYHPYQQNKNPQSSPMEEPEHILRLHRPRKDWPGNGE
ncbi:hypothetical protein KIN20_031466 [Parelaphostrongylus tenuis]|uniref:Uncharacterized protein n=1 Tax=Parelaphostrongylus tenuis TaxID=148309 RepID=A0AAD5R5K9_PARTN|nr:hypothetical protein KIN20_031457 [Parelaphostrongylus tenuis]KAJ1369881.1 hypothetical protein KIN20_031466 [Parelaphostrongylus tenuis]